MSHSHHRQQGFSLVELMVAMTIGLLLLAGLVSLVTSTSRNYGELEKTSRQIENGRYAMDLLRREIEHAGFLGEYSHYSSNGWLTTVPANPGILLDPCSLTTANIQDGLFFFPLSGVNNAAASPGACGLADLSQGSDILVVRRLDATAPANLPARPNLALGQLYMQTDADSFLLRAASAADDTEFNLTYRDTTAADIRPVLARIFFVSSSDNTPTLNRAELILSGGAMRWRSEPLVEGIEAMQIEYGIDDLGNGSAERYIANPTAADFSNVVSVAVHLLVRNIDPTPGHQDTKTYNLGATAVNAFNDAYKRHVFSNVVRITNVSERRR